jgi:two-component system CheB/CheR fusion protein
MSDFFNSVNHKLKIFKSKGKVRQISDITHSTDYTGQKKNYNPAAFHGGRRLLRRGDEERVLERFVEGVSPDFFPLVLVVNESHEVLHIIGDVKEYFKLPSGKIYNDISKMASRELSIPVSTGIPKVLREQKDLKFSNIKMKNSNTVIDLLIKPLPGSKGQDQLAAVFIIESTKYKSSESEPEIQTFDLSKEAEDHIYDLEQELQFTRENLQATIEELETANEELQATNEELLASNEELQSTNEELQSTNEELHTVNAEYHNKIIELTELHNDLENILSASQIGKIILDENFEIRRFSRGIDGIFKIIDKDIGRPVTSIPHFIKEIDPVSCIRKVQLSHETHSSEIETEEGKSYLMRIVPYEVAPGSFSGTVLSFVDITEIVETRRMLQERETALEETASLARVGWWKYMNESGEHTWSDEVYRIHEVKPGTKFTPEEGISFYHADDRDIIRESFSKVVNEGIPYDITLRIITAKGNLRWIRTIGKPLFEDEKITGVFGAFQDITSITEVRQNLLESRELLFRAANASPALVWVSGLDKGCIWFNESWLSFTGRTMEQEIGSGWTEGVHPDDFDRCLDIYITAFDKRETFSMEYRLMRFDNVYRWIYDQGQPFYNENKEFTGYIGSCLDITDLKNAEDFFKDK